ncbi:ATP-binding protein [Clostridium tertium]|jgi:signal transduction histidine kinase|uniref:ATP-binding protein n=1 Tax=Clostridium tertium TaxID=1559 RepID=UPI000DCFC1B7|nr:ATP-binding protein [Clostridium tertium]MBU6135267.1 PAS domain-containing protein [Clostridium tertium]MDB1956559.1 ATP-binding protein [Clostridium tertium]MDB1959868.1 ATP-binding protein [Clostridium tertium]MDB1964188.1 ATP-binding protein [Clostridium tertium]MDB1967517.1 ATP-binding protein [Clostridium tertium]
MGNLVNFCMKDSKLERDCLDEVVPLDDLLNKDKSGMGVYSFPNLELIKSNKFYKDILENISIKRAGYLKMSLQEIMNVKEEDIILTLIKGAIKSGKTQISEEFIYKNKNGYTDYLKCVVTPVKEENSLIFLIITLFNVTESAVEKENLKKEILKLKEENSKLKEENIKLSEENIKLSEEFFKYKNVVENMTDGLIFLDKEGKVEFLNGAAEGFFYEPDKLDVLGQTLDNTRYYDLNGNTLKINELPSARALKGENITSMRVVCERPDKTIKTDISCNPLYSQNNEIVGAITSIRGLNDSLRVENCLKKQRDNFYNIINSLDLLICRFSYPDFKVIHYNKKVKEEIIYSNENIYSKFLQISCNDRETLDKEQKNNAMISGSNIKVVLSGKERYIETFYQYIFDVDGEIKEVIKVGIDITDKVSHQQELEEILKTQEEFFSFIAHEFRTPLTVMSSTTQLLNLVYRKDLPEKVVGYIDKINLSTLQQLRLVNNLLDITRADAGYLNVNLRNYDIVSMSKAITESVRSFAVRKDINLEFTCNIDKKIIAVDDEKYERILLNLLSNAIKFTKNGKTVKVELDSNDRFTNINVKDEGVGIPKEKQDVIFNRFGQVNNDLTRKSEGTGIGLCLVRLLINSMGGRIELTSQLGKGSTFTIILPNKVISTDTKVVDMNLMDNRLVQTMDMEFSNIYLD